MKQMRKVGFLFLVIVCLLGAGCGKTEGGQAGIPEGTQGPTKTPTATTTPTATPSPLPPADTGVYLDSTKSVEERVAALLAQMTLEEKIAQMVQPEQNEASGGASPADVKKYGIGSVLSGGGSAPAKGNTAGDWQDRILSYLTAARQTRLGIPLLYGVDAVHGHNNVADAVIFPHNIALGAANDEALVEKIGQTVASEVVATGIRWTFAPTVGLPYNERWGRTYECFGEETELVARLGAAYIRGFQGTLGTEGFLKGETIVATAKHYIGEGQTANGSNQGNVELSTEEWEDLLYEELLQPYRDAVEAGARSVMVSYNSIHGIKCHENKELITEVLKGELGFQGIVVSDYNGIDQVQGASYADKVAACVNAGIDIFMEPYDWKEFMKTLQQLVERGRVTQERIDDAVTRILTVKFELGLFDETPEDVKAAADAALLKFGSEEHREVAREAVRKSLVLLKNEDNGIWETLKQANHILVAGKKADDIGAQCGGWSISWQGSVGDITSGTTILEGIRAAAGDKTTITYDEKGAITGEEDVILLVVGEEPYAESSGDRTAGKLVVSAEDRYLIRRVAEELEETGKEIPVLLVILSGRPVTIAEEIEVADTVVAAWLPGTEGAGIADVLFGDYDFTGTLTYTWPWYAAHIAEKFTEESKVLFARGTGLRKDGSSILEGGTVTIGEKPEAPEEASDLTGAEIDLKAVNYRVEAEWMNSDSYLVECGTESYITYVGNWEGQWANTKWNVYISEPGAYRLHFVYAAEKASNQVAIYYASPYITDDGNANRTTIPVAATGGYLNYQESMLDVNLSDGLYEFKLMSSGNGVKMRLDYVWFELLETETP